MTTALVPGRALKDHAMPRALAQNRRFGGPDWTPTAIPDAFGFRRFLQDRAAEHRARGEACATSDGATSAADKAEECEEIIAALARYWRIE